MVVPVRSREQIFTGPLNKRLKGVVQKARSAFCDDERALVIDPTFEYGLQLLIVVSVCLTSEPLSAAPTGCD